MATIIGRILPKVRGVHSAEETYETLDIVTNENGSKSYMAKRDTPGTVSLENTDYWMPYMDVDAQIDTLNNAVESAQAAIAKANAAANKDELYHLSGGHFSQITFDAEHDVATWQMVVNEETAETEIVQGNAVRGSDYIACPRRLYMRFTDTGARAYLYFYTLENGEYRPWWDPLNASTSGGVMNYLNYKTVPSHALDLPEGTYMQISVVDTEPGDVLFYGWDGVKFGPAVSGVNAYTWKDGATGSLKALGNGGVVFPSTAKAVICTKGNGVLQYVLGVKDRVTTKLWEANNTTVFTFFEFPGGYDYYMARFASNAKTFNYTTESPIEQTIADYDKTTVTGDLGDWMCVFCEHESQKPSALALKTIDIGRKLCEIQWTAKKGGLCVDDIPTQKFQDGVTYNGIPYGGEWDKPQFVGWHVSLHTFVNAANDPDSIFYNGKFRIKQEDNTYLEYDALHYTLVCSSFATLAAGWPYPTTNHGFIYDPKVDIVRTNIPPLGAVWSDIFSHCVIPERVDQFKDGCAVSVYEQTRPYGLRTTRYSTVVKGSNDNPANSDRETFAVINGADYYDQYVIAAYHRDAHTQLVDPLEWYLDFDDLGIANGNARPYKGDKSIYTSEEDVLINIKNSATTLYILKEDGTHVVDDGIDVTGKTQINIKGYLGTSESEDGRIFYVYTDNNDTQESFEYVDVGKRTVEFTATGTTLEFSKTDFWYATVYFRGNPLLAYKYDVEKKRTGVSVPANKNNDYSSWFVNGAILDEKPPEGYTTPYIPVKAVFYKGKYGAYTVPIRRKS